MSMMPKRRHGFSDDIRLDLREGGHGHVFASVRSKDIVIVGVEGPVHPGLMCQGAGRPVEGSAPPALTGSGGRQALVEAGA